MLRVLEDHETFSNMVSEHLAADGNLQARLRGEPLLHLDQGLC